jgi:spermidine synthase
VTRASRFLILLFFSGFCGISYEILYARLLANLVGDQMAVSASILITFLLGIGVGTLFAHRLWRYLWIIEGAIGACGVAFAFGSGVLDWLLYASLPLIGTSLGSSVLLCILVLCLPAFLIGCSLPLFLGYLNVLRPGDVFADGYMIYNLGAAITALLIEFWLLRELGLRGALIAIATANLGVAAVLRFCFAELRDAAPTAQHKLGGSAPMRDKSALALISVGSAIFQLLMIKVSECLIGPFHETFALVLACILIGIALGAALTKRFELDFAKVVTLNLVGVLLFIWGFGEMVEVYANLYPKASQDYLSLVVLKFTAVFLLMVIPATTFGATIPALLSVEDDVAQESGELLCVSSIANVLGFLLMTFVLHLTLNYGQITGVIVLFSLLALVVHCGLNRRAVLIALVLGLVGVGVSQTFWDENTLYRGHLSFHSPSKLKEARKHFESVDAFKGHRDVFAILWADGDPYFFINGYISITLNGNSEKIVGAFSSIFAPNTDKALVLGVGSGATANTVGQIFEETTAVEINPAVLDNLFRMKDYNFDIEANPKVTLVLDDAIHFVKANTDRYALIINTVTSPLYFSSSKLYTDDFIRSVKRRLAPGGVYVTWVDARIGDRGVDITLNTLKQSFSHCGLGSVKDSYFLLLCSDEPIVARQASRVSSNPVLGSYFMSEHGILPELLPYGLLTDNAMELVGDTRAPINSLNFPSLEFHMSRLTERGVHKFKNRLRQRMSLEAQRDALSGQIPWNRFDLLAHVGVLLGGTTVISATWTQLVKEACSPEEFRLGFAHVEERVLRELAERTEVGDNHHAYGTLLLKKGEYTAAAKELRRAIELEPRLIGTHFNLAACYENLGQLDAAMREYLAEARIKDADDLPPRVGRLALRLRRYPQATEAFKEALRRRDSPGSRLGLVRALLGSKRRLDAIRACQEAVQRYPHVKALSDELARIRR